MKFLKKQLHILVIAVILLLAVSIGADAAQTVYINSADGAFTGLLTEAYAVGADGTALIGEERPWALTANGPRMVGADEDVFVGGGGLRYTDGSVRVAADRIKVGLYYYYSKNRDSSLEEARLENSVGSGYAFGYLDENRRFVQFDEDAVTEETELTMRPLGDTAIGVYITNTEELLYSVPSSGASNSFAIHPLSDGGDALTWFKGKRYYGDFTYADLGNGKLTVTNAVDIEYYVMGVVRGEMGSGFPEEALKAQAVAARSYAMYNIHAGAYARSCGFDLTNDDYSQVYFGYTEFQNIRSAVLATENQYLTYNGSVIDALFFSADGGETLDSEQKFPSALPYLRGITDPYEGKVWTKGPNGHQVGMSQWGAYAMARYYQKDYQDILGFYYTRVGISYGYV